MIHDPELLAEIRKACADDLRRWCAALVDVDPDVAETLARAALKLEDAERARFVGGGADASRT